MLASRFLRWWACGALVLAAACFDSAAPEQTGSTPAGGGGSGGLAGAGGAGIGGAGAGDPCERRVGAEPVALIGTGAKAFEPFDDFAVVPLVAGEQGGHHVWIAVRSRYLRQPEVIKLTAHVPDLDLDLDPLSFAETLQRDARSGYCEIAGVVLQLDVVHDMADLYGMVLEVTAEVGDGAETVTVQRTLTLPDVP
jgi:hypothetical protein